MVDYNKHMGKHDIEQKEFMRTYNEICDMIA